MPRTFTLLKTLGRGAHGAVHLAELRDDDDYVQTLAIKRLLPEWTSDPDLVARLKDEARLLALLHHDHVVRVHGLTRVEGSLAILMEPVEGTDLQHLLARGGALPPRVALEVVEAVADALDAAFGTVPPGQERALHVVHRDIKPSNVMVTPRGGVKVMDFGVARATFDAREGETRSQQFGTARYMAPERWLHGRADHRSDVFSLGITLVELTTGAPVARPRLSAEGFGQDLAAATAALPPDLRALALRMTSFASDARPSAAEVAAACRGLLASTGGPTLREWALAHVLPAAGEPVDPTETATVVREDLETSRPRRTPLRWLPLALLPLLALPLFLPRAPLPVPAPVPVSVPSPPVPAPSVPADAPDPAPVAPPRPRPAPPPPAPVAPDPPRTVPVRFVLESPDLTATTDFGRVTASPVVLELPEHRSVQVHVDEGGRGWSCTISTGRPQVRIFRQAEGGCIQ